MTNVVPWPHRVTEVREERGKASPGAVVVGVYLRALRREKDLSLAEAAAAIGRSAATLSRLETAVGVPQEGAVVELLRLYGLRRHQAAATRHLLSSSFPGRCADLGPGSIDRYAACQQEATLLRISAPNLVPTVFQTEEFAKAVAESRKPWRNPTGAVPFPTAQLADRREYTLFLDEFAIRRQIGSRTVMAGQLAHLCSLAEQGIAKVLIVPRERWTLMPGVPLTELQVNGTPLFAEIGMYIIYSSGQRARQYSVVLNDHLPEQALSQAESLDFLNQARARFLEPP